MRHGQSLNNVLMAESHSAYDKARVSDAPLTALGETQARVTGAFLAEYFKRRPGNVTLYTSAFSRAAHTASHIAAALRTNPVLWTDVHETGGIFEHVYDASGGLIAYRGVGGLTLPQLRDLFPLVLLPDSSHTGVTADIDETGWWHSSSREMAGEAEVRVQRVVGTLRSRAGALVESSTSSSLLDGLHAAAGVDAPGAVRETDITPSRPPAVAAYDDSIPRASGRVETVIIVCHGDFIDTFMRVVFAGPAAPGALPSAHMQVCHYNCGITWMDFYPDGGVRIVRVNDASHLQYAAMPDRLGFDSLLTGGPV